MARDARAVGDDGVGVQRREVHRRRARRQARAAGAARDADRSARAPTWARSPAAATFRLIGEQFDDDRNDFLLERGSLVDARAGWRLSRRLELFGAIENAFDEEIDTGRTPIRTVGGPRIGRGGAIVRF